MSSSYTPPGRPDDIVEASTHGSTAVTPPATTSTSRVPAPAPAPAPRPARALPDPGAVAARQEERYGGIKIGSALFGWLTAAGIATLLTTLLTATGAAIGLANTADAGQAASNAAASAQNGGAAADTAKTIGLVGGIALLLILFAAYYCGGYVAGRMARFNGTKQGLAVWLWGLVIALVTAAVAAIAGAKFDVLATLNLPRLPINEGTLTTGGLIAVLAIALTTLAGALIGGKAGMHFHRKVDEAGYHRNTSPTD